MATKVPVTGSTQSNQPTSTVHSSTSTTIPTRMTRSQTKGVIGVVKAHRSPDEPTMKKALASPQAEQWKEAIAAELKQLEDLGCFIYEDLGLPSHLPKCFDPPLPTHFVLKLKRRADFSIDKFKARLVVDGSRQTEDQYVATMAPTGTKAIVMMALALATHMGWEMASCDITAAYITADIDCPIRVRIPSIDGSGPPRTARLIRSLYGLKQAGRLFWEHLKGKFVRIWVY